MRGGLRPGAGLRREVLPGRTGEAHARPEAAVPGEQGSLGGLHHPLRGAA